MSYYPEERAESISEISQIDFSKEFIFSGGAISKIEGDTSYEEIVTYILDKYDDINFYYAGQGKSRILDRLKKFPGCFFKLTNKKT